MDQNVGISQRRLQKKGLKVDIIVCLKCQKKRNFLRFPQKNK